MSRGQAYSRGMSTTSWTVTASDGGTLQMRTGVTGRASKMGHRLTLAMTNWTVSVEQSGDVPASVSMRASVDSLEVTGGEGGVTPMFGPEKLLARSNALGCFDAKKYPDIAYDATDVEKTGGGYRLSGALQIHGVTRDHVVDVAVSADTASCHTVVTQTDFGIKPYSQLLGAMKVVDDVEISFESPLPR